MSFDINIHCVNKIRATAYPLKADKHVFWYQKFEFFDSESKKVGGICAFLVGPEAALPVGDSPPYWGADLSGPLAMNCMAVDEDEVAVF